MFTNNSIHTAAKTAKSAIKKEHKHNRTDNTRYMYHLQITKKNLI